MARYLFLNYESSSEAPNWQTVLLRAHSAKIQPACLCRYGERPPMVIAKRRDQCVIRRMPNTGSLHAPFCDHYTPPPELSGIGQVSGSAVREDAESETTVLSLDFALTKGQARPKGAEADTEHESVRSDGTKLTMRATLHYLYDQATLTRWSPKMAGRRSWNVIRRELLKAAADKRAKGVALSDLIFIPESFNLDDAQGIAERRASSLARLSASPSNRMMIIAPLKNIEQARFGYKVTLRHLPDMPLACNEDIHRRLHRVFATQLALWGQLEHSHLLLTGTISLAPGGLHTLESACLTNVDSAWIPFESLYEYQLLEALGSAERRFLKGLRYNLAGNKPLACAILLDTGDSSTAMYVVPQDAEGDYEEAAKKLTEQSNMKTWFWYAGTAAMPELPPREFGQKETDQEE